MELEFKLVGNQNLVIKNVSGIKNNKENNKEKTQEQEQEKELTERFLIAFGG